MAKKRYYDEHGNQIRSKPSKPFYKKWLAWLILLFGVLIAAIGIYTLGNKEEVLDDSVKKVEIKKEKKEVFEDSKNVESKKESTEEQAYTYEDFKGTYVIFEGEPYKSPIRSIDLNIVVLGDDSYRSFNRWDFDMTSTVKNKTIEGKILTLEVDSDENEVWGLHSESGTEQFELRHDGDKKMLYSVTDDYLFYSMTEEDLQTHYTQSEIDYARIIMTVQGKPSLDQWAVWEDEWGDLVIDVSHDSAGDPTEVSKQVTYPKNVTHIDLTSQMMAAGVITYSSYEVGKITRYPMPLHYHQEDQSEEGYRKLAQDAIDDADKIEIKPFDPYTVADFIGRVEFVDE